jgi:hypothetical protein
MNASVNPAPEGICKTSESSRPCGKPTTADGDGRWPARPSARPSNTSSRRSRNIRRNPHAQLPDGSYYVSLTATTIDDEEPQLLNQEIDSRRGVSLDEVLAVIKGGLTGST